MSLQIYNTLTRKKEEFVPLNPGRVGMYVCGVTVYDYCHLGHARALVNFDVIYRYLKYKGFAVTYVRNFTDVDDKIINKANQEKIAWNQVSEKYIQAFNEDVGSLAVEKPTVEPKATEHIPEMGAIIAQLLKKDYAYVTGGDVFYSVRKKLDYGKLSGKKIEELEVGARIEVQESKKDPLDFALWKSSKPGEPAWPTAWGEGRPGWHIECSAMSMKYLGETFDIHGGGRDLSFPHHENEIAQSEAANGKPFARYWVHNGFVNINTEKMSKSLGNFLTIRELLKSYHPEVIRLFILSAHYRSPLDYTEQNMAQARTSLNRWYATLKRVCEAYKASWPVKDDPMLTQKINDLKNEFTLAMDDDFNTAKVTGLLLELSREWNRVLDKKQILGKEIYELFLSNILEINEFLGIFGGDFSSYIQQETGRILQSLNLTAESIELQIIERRNAKQNKDYKKADEIRNQLTSKGVQLKDNPDGVTTWSVL